MQIEWPLPAQVLPGEGPRCVVVDTNVVLDLLVFADMAAVSLRQALSAGSLRWLATLRMREELKRVLHYPQIALRLTYYGLTSAQVLATFDAQVNAVADAPRACAVCKDPDDQMFIDLAVQHGALLLSKDAAVLRLRKRLQALGVQVLSAVPA